MARRTRRFFRGGRVVDLGGGHGLVGQLMVLLDDTSPEAVVVDTAIPPSAVAVHEVMARAWPRLSGRIKFKTASMQFIELTESDVVVSSHACGAMTDQVIERAVAASAPVAVLPCCHDIETCDAGCLGGWMDSALAIDTMRAVRLERQGYRVWTQTIPAAITPKNRLLLAAPESNFHSR
ncbi:MAG TPA: methyltransferase [Vicinamibacterales bacterium]|nr:methyltransferase [Vicinamibacterales bacterium]